MVSTDIIVKIGPATDEKEGLEFESSVKGGNVPKEFIPAVEKGFKTAMENGVLAGFPMDSRVELMDGSFHQLTLTRFHSSKLLSSLTTWCSPKILEPMMALEVVTPEKAWVIVLVTLTSVVLLSSTDERSGKTVINAKEPLSEMFGYVTDLRTLTSGRYFKHVF